VGSKSNGFNLSIQKTINPSILYFHPMKFITCLSLFVLFLSCKNKSVKEQEDSLYSRHLQRKVTLKIWNTALPSDKNELNLLLLNDGQDAKAIRVKEILDSLDKAGQIMPLLIVGIEAGDRMQEYGVAGKPDYEKRGSKADNYDAFINDELYFFIKKKAGVRKFKSVAIAGWSLGGLSAFDIAFNHPEKIDKAGIFSGSFWWRDKDTKDSTYQDDKNRIEIARIKASRRKSKQDFWFYAGQQEEPGDRDKDGITDVIDDTQDIRNLLIEKGITDEQDSPLILDPKGQHAIPDWGKQFPGFLVWAFGK